MTHYSGFLAVHLKKYFNANIKSACEVICAEIVVPVGTEYDGVTSAHSFSIFVDGKEHTVTVSPANKAKESYHAYENIQPTSPRWN